MALDSPEYSVLAETRIGNVMLSKPVPTAATPTDTQGRKLAVEKHEIADSPGCCGGGDERPTTLSVCRERSGIASGHLPRGGYRQWQRNKTDAQALRVYQIGGEITECPSESDALRQVDRHCHAENRMEPTTDTWKRTPQLRTRSRWSIGSQSQFARSPTTSTRP